MAENIVCVKLPTSLAGICSVLVTFRSMLNVNAEILIASRCCLECSPEGLATGFARALKTLKI